MPPTTGKLIIWAANIPEETEWYLHRTGHGWQYMALALVVFHFAVPFMVLLHRAIKRNAAANYRLHGWTMSLAFVVSTLFLVGYLTHKFTRGEHHADGQRRGGWFLVRPMQRQTRRGDAGHVVDGSERGEEQLAAVVLGRVARLGEPLRRLRRQRQRRLGPAACRPAPWLEREWERSSYFFVTFFLPAMARRGPFLVRALV